MQGSKLLSPAFTAITLDGKLPLGPAPAGHNGGAPGTSTDLQLYPDRDWCRCP